MRTEGEADGAAAGLELLDGTVDHVGNGALEDGVAGDGEAGGHDLVGTGGRLGGIRGGEEDARHAAVSQDQRKAGGLAICVLDDAELRPAVERGGVGARHFASEGPGAGLDVGIVAARGQQQAAGHDGAGRNSHWPPHGSP